MPQYVAGCAWPDPTARIAVAVAGVVVLVTDWQSVTAGLKLPDGAVLLQSETLQVGMAV